MMRAMQMIPNKLYLAMNAALFIAYNGSENAPVSGGAIVEYCNLNKRALEPILQRLAVEDIVVSVKGSKGGYYMSQPENVTLRDVAEAFIRDVVPQKHEFAGYNKVLDQKLELCFDGWLDSLSDISFKRLCRKTKTIGHVSPMNDFELTYTI